MFHTIAKMFSMVWSFLNLFTFEVHYKSYDNREITAEYMPAIIPTSGVLPLNNGDFLETDLTFQSFFRSSFFLFSFYSLNVLNELFVFFFFLILFLSSLLVGQLFLISSMSMCSFLF